MKRILRAARQNRRFDLILFALLVLVMLAAIALLPAPEGMQLEGRARAIDGDSLMLLGSEIRLQGIDAPEAVQTCTREGRAWDCGREAARQLTRLLRSGEVRCEAHERDQHDRLLATCWAGETEINRRLVEQGWAVSFGRYQLAERQARNAKRGLWAGDFERPSDWRADHLAN